MTTPKQDLKRLLIIEDCHTIIQRKGAHARIEIRMPGAQRGQKTRRFSAKGPHGQIVARTHDGQKILVMFGAAKLITSLEKVRQHVQTA